MEDSRGIFKFKSQTDAQKKFANHEERTSSCKKCDYPVTHDADLCESCGAWLLEDKCSFCYSPVSIDQKFCHQCGSKPAGMFCSKCNISSHFDFCPGCNDPLTRRAKKMVDTIANDSEINAIKSAVEATIPAENNIKHGETDREVLSQLKHYGQQDEPTSEAPVSKPFRFGSTGGDMSNLMKQTPEEQRKRAAEEQRKKLEEQQRQAAAAEKARIHELKIRQEQAQNHISRLQEKTFEDHQSARAFYSGIKSVVESQSTCISLLGWRCNYAYAVHYDGPSGCFCPKMGGRWICLNEVTWLSSNSFILEGETYSPQPETPRSPTSN